LGFRGIVILARTIESKLFLEWNWIRNNGEYMINIIMEKCHEICWEYRPDAGMWALLESEGVMEEDEPS